MFGVRLTRARLVEGHAAGCAIRVERNFQIGLDFFGILRRFGSNNCFGVAVARGSARSLPP
jgi:hypothetical protein